MNALPISSGVLALLVCNDLPAEGQPPILEVTKKAGYTTWLAAFQVEGYPLLVLHADGTLIASEHRFVPGAVEYTIHKGKLAGKELEKLVAALPYLLPVTEEPRAHLIDAGSVHVGFTEDGERKEIELVHLAFTLPHLLGLSDLSAEERAAADRRLRFSELISQLRQTHALEPYVPERAKIVVVPYDLTTVRGRRPAICEWPVTELSLPDLARRSKPVTGNVEQPIVIRDEITLHTLAHTVVSNRFYRAGGATYLVAWIPVWP